MFRISCDDSRVMYRGSGGNQIAALFKGYAGSHGQYALFRKNGERSPARFFPAGRCLVESLRWSNGQKEISIVLGVTP